VKGKEKLTRRNPESHNHSEILIVIVQADKKLIRIWILITQLTSNLTLGKTSKIS
jgi:hypothetical protein